MSMFVPRLTLGGRWACYGLALILQVAMEPSHLMGEVGRRLDQGSALGKLEANSVTPFRVEWDEVLGTVSRLEGLEVEPTGTEDVDRAKTFLREYRDLFLLADPDAELSLRSSQRGLSGTHVRFDQMFRGLPVDGGGISVHLNHDGVVFLVQNFTFPRVAVETVIPSLEAEAAVTITRRAFNEARFLGEESVELVILANRGMIRNQNWERAYRLAFRVILPLRKPSERLACFIDAESGKLIRRRNLLRYVDGGGRVFNPSPVVALKDPSLRDQDDSADAIPLGAYEDVVLLGLDGSGFLDGTYVTTAPTPGRVREENLEFYYLRDQAGFEEVMTYFHLDSVMRYLSGSGFGFVDGWQLPVNARFSGEDNSYYDPSDLSLQFGTGGVDDAEDAEVVIHEFGHALQDRQVPGYGESHGAASMGEGFGDFLAAAFLSAVSDGFHDTTVFDWDGSGSFGLSNRRVDTGKRYPDDIVDQIHQDGEIWSAALWDIFSEIGRDESIRLAVESHFLVSPRATFEEGAVSLLLADTAINDGANQPMLERVLDARGFLREPKLAADRFEPNESPESARAIALPFVRPNLSIGSSTDMDFYSFSLSEGGAVQFAVKHIPYFGELTGELRRVGEPDFSEDLKGERLLQLGPGDYLLGVFGVDGSTNDYELQVRPDDHGNDRDNGTLVQVGDVIDGGIGYEGDTDSFLVELNEGQHVEFYVESTDGALDPKLTLFLPNGEELASNDDISFENYNSFVGVTVPISGTYHVSVDSYVSEFLDHPTGDMDYQFFIRSGSVDAHGDCDSGKITPIIANRHGSGVIDLAGDVDAFQFSASQDDLIEIIVEGEFGSPLTPAFRVFDAKGRLLGERENNGADSSVRWSGLEIPEQGAYCVEVRSSDESAGGSIFSYHVTYRPFDPDGDDHFGPENPTRLVEGRTEAGLMNFPGDSDYFDFLAKEGQQITLDIDASVNGSLMDPVLTLYNEDLEELFSSDDDLDSLDPLIDAFSVPETGRYFCRVGGFSDDSGESYFYSIVLSGTGSASVEERLTILAHESGGWMVELQGDAGSAYVLEKTSDFISWKIVGDEQGTIGGLSELITTDSSDAQFFRARRLRFGN